MQPQLQPQQPLQEGQRPHTISSSFERGGLYNRPLLNGQTFLAPTDASAAEKKLPNSEPVSPSKINNGSIHSDLQTYSTIKRSYRYGKLFGPITNFIEGRSPSRHTHLNFTLLASQNVPGAWYCLFNSNSYADYGNMIHFAVTVWTTELA